MKVKESVLASVLSSIFTVFLVFTMIFAANAWYIKSVFLNPNKFMRTMNLKVIARELEREILTDDITEDERKIYEGVFESDFFTIIFSEFYEAALYGDAKIDHDAVREEINPIVEAYIEANDLDEIEDLDDQIDELLDDIEDELGQIAYSKDMEQLQLMVKKVNRQIDFVFYGCILGSVVMIAVLFIVYVNKYRPVFFTGLALTISQGLCLLGALSIDGLIKYALKAATAEVPSSDDDLYLGIAKNMISGFTKEAAILFGTLLIIGIALIVAGRILSKNFETVEDIE